MRESAKAQHEVDKANFAAAKAEAKAQLEEAKAMSKPKNRMAILQAERDEQINKANKRIEEAQKRLYNTK